MAMAKNKKREEGGGVGGWMHGIHSRETCHRSLKFCHTNRTDHLRFSVGWHIVVEVRFHSSVLLSLSWSTIAMCNELKYFVPGYGIVGDNYLV